MRAQLTSAAGCFLRASALPAAADDLADCRSGVIPACTKPIGSSSASSQDVTAALIARGLSSFKSRDNERALADFDRVIEIDDRSVDATCIVVESWEMPSWKSSEVIIASAASVGGGGLPAPSDDVGVSISFYRAVVLNG